MAKRIQSTNLFISIILVLFLSPFPDSRASQSSSTIPGFDCYRTSETIQQTVQILHSTYPNLVQLTNIGASFEGQPIQLIKLGNQSTQNDKPRLVLISGLRANSFAPVEINLQFIENLLTTYGENPSSTWILDFTEVYAILLANPDGRLRAELQAEAGQQVTWQNNTNLSYCSSNPTGVRLNHNFPFEWSVGNPDPCSESFHGPSAGSEPETQALKSFLESLADNPNPTLLLHLDSYENSIITPYQYDEDIPNPHVQDLFILANKLAYDTWANPLAANQSSFEIPGNLLDYAFWELDIPGLTYKLGTFQSGEHATACWYFTDYLLGQTKNALLRAAHASPSAYSLGHGPETEILTTNSSLLSISFEGHSNDFSFYKNFVSNYSSVEKMTWSADLPPWHPQAGIRMVTDLITDPEFPFMSSFSLTIPYTDLDPGKHLLFFQGWDSAEAGSQSKPGFVASTFIEVPNLQFIPLIRK